MRYLFFLITLICILTLASLASLASLAQVPVAFKYQVVIRNSTGEILPSQNISMRISILDGSATSSSVFTEIHSTNTNTYGMVSIIIGKGTLVSGDLSTINWGTSDKYLKVELDENGGSSYTDLGAVELLSIPYAFYANDVMNKDDADANPTNEIQVLSISNDTVFLSSGGYVKLPIDLVDDSDNDPSNEIQDLNLDGDVLTITNNSSPTAISLARHLQVLIPMNRNYR